MKYNVVFSCGHEGVVDLKGDAIGEGRLKWFEEHGKCPACNNPQSVQISFDLPSLRGSSKQVSWASSIRNNFFRKLENDLQAEEAKAHGFLKGQSNLTLAKRDIEILRTYFAKKIEATFWIDNRNNFESLIKKVLESESA